MKNLLIFVLLLGVLLLLGPALDSPSEHAAAQATADTVRLARAMADMEARIERAALRACRDALGTGDGTTHVWSERNELVCIPPLTNPKGTI